MILSIFLRLDPVFNMGSRDSQSWMFKFCNAIKKVAHHDDDYEHNCHDDHENNPDDDDDID